MTYTGIFMICTGILMVLDTEGVLGDMVHFNSVIFNCKGYYLRKCLCQCK